MYVVLLSKEAIIYVLQKNLELISNGLNQLMLTENSITIV